MNNIKHYIVSLLSEYVEIKEKIYNYSSHSNQANEIAANLINLIVSSLFDKNQDYEVIQNKCTSNLIELGYSEYEAQEIIDYVTTIIANKVTSRIPYFDSLNNYGQIQSAQCLKPTVLKVTVKDE